MIQKHLYRKIVIPTLLYECDLWNNLKQADLQVLNEFQHFVMKDISSRSDICKSLFSLIYPVFQKLIKENY